MARNVQIKGYDKMIKALSKKTKKAKKIPEMIHQITEDSAQLARDTVPVDTGNLRGSIQTEYKDGGKTGIIHTGDNRYAAHVEFGTKKHGPEQPFIRPAQDQGRDEVVKKVQEIVKA